MKDRFFILSSLEFHPSPETLREQLLSRCGNPTGAALDLSTGSLRQDFTGISGVTQSAPQDPLTLESGMIPLCGAGRVSILALI